MNIHAESKGRDGPLAGGRDGATVSVEPLVAGHISWPSATMESPGGRLIDLKLARAVLTNADPVLVPCPAFLLRHPGVGAILVDTGLHPSLASDPRQNFGRLGARFAPVTLKQGEDVPAQLRARNIDPHEVKVVVMTHLHFDHAS